MDPKFIFFGCDSVIVPRRFQQPAGAATRCSFVDVFVSSVPFSKFRHEVTRN